MALRTLGTNATTSLGGFLVGTDDFVPATVALINQIKTEIPMVNQALLTGIPRNLINGGYTQQGVLVLPGNRGVITCKVGDFIGLDPVTGWPIVLSADCAQNGAFTHT
jgi:hypothetical protein